MVFEILISLHRAEIGRMAYRNVTYMPYVFIKNRCLSRLDNRIIPCRHSLYRFNLLMV